MPPSKNETRVCIVDGCSKTFSCKGFCADCYQKAKRNPELFPEPIHYDSYAKQVLALYQSENWNGLLEKLKEKRYISPSGCWEWTGKRDKLGYGEIHTYGKQLKFRFGVHRIAAECKNKGKLGKESAHHICSNRACFNPEHLQAISQRENVAEMFERKYYIARIKQLENENAELNLQLKLVRG